MGFSTEDKYLMKCLRENNKYGAKQLLKMFPNKNWSLYGLKVLIKKTDNTGTVVRRIWQWSTSHCLHSTCVVK